MGRSRWPRGSAVVRLIGLRVRISPGARMSVSCKCCALLGRVLCDRPISRPERSYTECGVFECDREASIMRGPWPTGGFWPVQTKSSNIFWNFWGWQNTSLSKKITKQHCYSIRSAHAHKVAVFSKWHKFAFDSSNTQPHRTIVLRSASKTCKSNRWL